MINQTIGPAWFMGSGTILEMSITDFTIVSLSPESFTSMVFVKMKTMKLCGFRVNFLFYKTFSGLAALQVLELNSFDLLHIQPDILAPCEQLHIFEIKNSFRKEFSIDAVMGRRPIQNLKIVTLRDNNLGNTITEATFTGLVQVLILDLNRNKITSIGPRSFDAIAKTLNVLILRNNLLKELPGDIFVNVFLHADMTLLQILLEGNLWHCDCYLQPMQQFLIKYSMTFTGFARCESPLKWRYHPIEHARFCEDHTTIPDSTYSPPTKPITATKSPPKDSIVPLKCMKHLIQNLRTFVSVGLKKQDKVIRLHQTLGRKFTVTLKDFPADYTVLWYERATHDKRGVNRNSMNCFLNSNRNRTHNISLGDSWRKNKVHTFCMKPKNSPTMTPLNCVSFDTVERLDYSAKMWLPKSFRFVAIVLIIIASLLCVLFGLGIVICLALKYPWLFHPRFQKKSVVCSKEFNDGQISRESSDQCKKIDQLYLTRRFSGSSDIQDCEFGYMICHRVSSISHLSVDPSVPPPLPPPHPDQLKRRSQMIKKQDDSNIYCELN